MNETRGESFSAKKNIAHRDGAEKKHGNEVEITAQKKTNLIQKDGGEEGQEEYPTSVPYT